MQVIILAAGEGSRLAPLTSYIPKPLLPIRGKPLLLHIIDALISDEEIGDDIVVVCQEEFREQFIHHTQGYIKQDWVRLYAFDKPAGTAGEILRLQDYLDDEFVVYYADIWTKFRVSEAIRWWSERKENAIACLVASKRLQVDKGVPTFIDLGKERTNTITEIREKPELPIPNLMGIGIYKKRVLKYAEPGADLHGDTLPRAIGGGEKVLAYLTDEGYEDLGTLRAYKAVQKGGP